MMPEEPPLTMNKLLEFPTAFRVLLAMLEHGQVYQFQLTLITGAHRATVVTAITLLTQGKLIKTVEPIVYVKNVGEFYALTPHGVHVATRLKELAKSLETVK
jgi:hypothetical protein